MNSFRRSLKFLFVLIIVLLVDLSVAVAQSLSDFTDTFSENPNTSGRWSIHRRNSDPFNEANWNQSLGIWYLTRAVDGRAVAVFANYELSATKWIAQFDMKIGGGDGADGLAFMFYKDESRYGTPNGGGALGFIADNKAVPGYGVAFATFGTDRVSLIQDKATNVLTSTSSVSFRDNTFHFVEVSFDNGVVVVKFDGAQILQHSIVNPDYSFSGIGFSAATGAFNDNHIIDNFRLFISDVRVDRPNGGEFWAGGSNQTIKWTVGGPASLADKIVLSYSTDGGASFPNIIASNLSASASQFDWSVPSGLNSSNARIKIEAKDNAGLLLASDVSNTSFTIDSEPPSTFNLTTPSNGEWVDSTPTFQWNFSTDNFALSHYRLVIDSQVIRDSLNTRQYTVSGTEALAAGFHIWNVVAVDKAGNERQSQETRSIRVDDDNPLAFSLISPANDSWTSLTLPEFQWQPSVDVTSDIREYELMIDGKLARSNIAPNITKATPIFPLSFGDHQWYVIASDSAGNRTQSIETWKIKVDNVPPGGVDGLLGVYHASPGSGSSPNFGSRVGQRIDPTINFDWGSSSPGLGVPSNDFQIRWTGFLHTKNGGNYIFRTHSDDGARLWIGDDLIIDAWREGAGDVFSNQQTLQPDTLYTIKMEYYENQTFARARLYWIPPAESQQIIPLDNLRVYPVRAFVPISPPNNEWLGDPTPRFEWQTPEDVGIGVLSQSLWINEAEVIKNISRDSSGINLPEENQLSGTIHTWFVEAVDSLGNVSRTPTWTIKLDLEPPTMFSLKSPSDSSSVLLPTPTFSWNASFDNKSGLSHYQIWIDGQLNTDNLQTTSSAPSVPVSIGIHGWFVRAIDEVGNVRNSSEIWTLFFDPNPPGQFDLVLPTDGDTVNTSLPTLSWQPSDDPESGLKMYQLFINGTLNRSNIPPSDTSTVPISPLQNNQYNWFVKAVDFAGNSRSSNSVRTFIVNRDITPPISDIVEPTNGITIGGDSFIIRGTANDGTGSGVALAEVRLDGGNWNPTANTGTDFDTWQYLWTDYTEGTHTIQSRAIDKEGNTETSSSGVTVTVNRSTPSISSLNISPDPAKVGQVTVTMNLDAGAGEIDNSVSPTVTFSPANDTTKFVIQQNSFQGSTWVGTATITEGMNNGTAIIQVEGVQNTLGNVMPPLNDAGSFMIDTVSPLVSEVTVTPDPAKVGDINVNVTFTEETSGINTNIRPIATITFTPNNGSPIPIALTGYIALTKTVQGVGSITSSLNDGLATIQVKNIEDLAGNVMQDNNNAGQFSIDVTPPESFSLLSPADSSWTKERLPSLSWNPSNDVTTGLAYYQLFINSELNVDNISPSQTSVVPNSEFNDGDYSWKVLASDSAGNTRESDSTWLLRVDKTAPESEIRNLTSGQGVSGTVIIEGTAHDGSGIGVDSVLVSIDNGVTWHATTSTAEDFSNWQYEWNVSQEGPITILTQAIDKLGNEETPHGITVTDVEEKAQNPNPTEFALSQNYPNPFNPETTIEYQLPEKARISLKIYNLMGQEITTLVDEEKEAGYFKAIWDGRDFGGRKVASGIYVYQIRAGDFVASRKLIMMK